MNNNKTAHSVAATLVILTICTSANNSQLIQYLINKDLCLYLKLESNSCKIGQCYLISDYKLLRYWINYYQ